MLTYIILKDNHLYMIFQVFAFHVIIQFMPIANLDGFDALATSTVKLIFVQFKHTMQNIQAN